MGYAVKGQYLSFSGVIQETPDTTYGTVFNVPADGGANGATTLINNYVAQPGNITQRQAVNVAYKVVGTGDLYLYYWLGEWEADGTAYGRFRCRPYYMYFPPAGFGLAGWQGQTVEITYFANTTGRPDSLTFRLNGSLYPIVRSSNWFNFLEYNTPILVQARAEDPIGYFGPGTRSNRIIIPDFSVNPATAGYFQFPGAQAVDLRTLNTQTVSSVFSVTDASNNFKNSAASISAQSSSTILGSNIVGPIQTLSAETSVIAAYGAVVFAQATLSTDTQIPGDSYLVPDYLNPFEDVELLENYVDEQYFDGSYVAGGSISYTLPDYAESGYFIGAKTKGYYFSIFDPSIILGGVVHTSTAFTVTATPEFLVGGIAQLASEFDIAPLGNVAYDDTANLESEFAVDEATENIFYGTATIESAFAVAESVGLVFDIQAASTASTQLSSTATNIIDLASTYAGQNYADPTYFDDTLPLTLFTQFATTATGTTEIIPNANIQGSADITVVGGYLQTAGTVSINSTASFTLSPYITGGTGVIIGSTQFNRAASSTVTASALQSLQAQSALVTEFTQSADAGNPIIAASTLAVTFAQALQFDLFRGTTIPANTEFTTAALAGYRHFGAAAIDSLGFVLAVGKILIIDEYYLVTVSPESRRQGVIIEPRLRPVAPETVLLAVLPDITDIVVDPETRRLRIPLAPAVAVGNRTRRLS